MQIIRSTLSNISELYVTISRLSSSGSVTAVAAGPAESGGPPCRIRETTGQRTGEGDKCPGGTDQLPGPGG